MRCVRGSSGTESHRCASAAGWGLRWLWRRCRNSEFGIRNLTSGIAIVRRALEAVVAHARAEAPRECCGLLLGRPDSVSEAVAARNIAAMATRFLVDPQDHINTLRAARGRGLEIL
ncbi:MAG: hypothetical protein DMF98_11715, partial [Acidobacteria bacterium]